MASSSPARFSDYIGASLPEGLNLPAAFVAALDWMEENGCVRSFADDDERRYATLYPGQPSGRGMSCVSIRAVDPEDAIYWMGKDVPGSKRLAPFIRTGFDGSSAALWLDPNDRLRFVHLGSGSGSSWAGVITDDPIEMLRFLGMGYPEPCWPQYFGLTPEEAYDADDFSDEAPFTPPRQFQQWLSSAFGATIPSHASEVIHTTPNMDAVGPTDPFLLWLRSAQGQVA